MAEAKQSFEAVVLNSFDHNGEKKWKRTFIGNLLADNNGGDGYSLFIPEGISVSGRLRIQPKQEKQEGPENSL